jgi:hypothetical protein
MSKHTLHFTLLAASSALLSSATLTTSVAMTQVSDASVLAVNVARDWINTNAGLSYYGGLDDQHGRWRRFLPAAE